MFKNKIYDFPFKNIYFFKEFYNLRRFKHDNKETKFYR